MKKKKIKYPVGLQDFKKIASEGYLYVDKTESIVQVINNGTYYFLSRPRRFGKSLTLSTIEYLFSGEKEIFKGLWAYKNWKFEKHPVIKLNCNTFNSRNDENILINGIFNALDFIAREYKIKLTNKNSIGESLQELVIKLYKAYEKQVVILIDEYDKPIIDVIEQPEKAERNRDILKSLYAPIKSLDKYLKFFILTGVSKFSKVSLFSDLNNLSDISMDKRYGTIQGITEEELEKYFYTNESDNEKNIVREWYNGYSFDGVNKVYNPFSTLKYFDTKELSNYWFETGTPTFLLKLIKEKNYNIVEFEKTFADASIGEKLELKSVDLIPLLYQTGYLTIKKQVANPFNPMTYQYEIGYPNKEVKDSLNNQIFSSYLNTPTTANYSKYMKIYTCFQEENFQKLETILTSMFAGIPYLLNEPDQTEKERFYQKVFYIVLSMFGADLDLESMTNVGRIDAVLTVQNRIYVIEFKSNDSAENALKQIKDKKYYEKYLSDNKRVILLGMGGFTSNNIRCIAEKVPKK